MTIVDLHPDELFDKEILGQLSPSERTRLDAHVKACAACRMEREARGDFFGEVLAEGQFGNLVGIVSIVPTAVPGARISEVPASRPAAEPVHAARRLPVARPWSRGRGRMPAVLAMLLVATATVTGWTRVRDSLHRWSAPSAPAPAAPPATSPTVPAAKNPGPAPLPVREVDTPAPSSTAVVGEAPEVDAPRPVAMAPLVRHGTLVPLPVDTTPVAPPSIASRTRVDSTPRAEPGGRVDEGQVGVPETTRVTAGSLFAHAGEARRSGDYNRAVTLYRDLATRFPASHEATAGQAVVAQILLDRGDAPAALGHFDAYLARGGALGEDALAGRALALQRLGRRNEEAQAWSALLAAYPNSVHAARARAQLAILGAP